MSASNLVDIFVSMAVEEIMAESIHKEYALKYLQDFFPGVYEALQNGCDPRLFLVDDERRVTIDAL